MVITWLWYLHIQSYHPYSLVSDEHTIKLTMPPIKFVLLVLLILSVHSLSLSLQHPAINGLLHRLNSLRPTSSVQESAAKGLLQRLIPTHSHSFEFTIISKVLPFLSPYTLFSSVFVCFLQYLIVFFVSLGCLWW